MKKYSNLIAFDDAPFARDYRGQVKVVGTIFANLRFDGLLIGEIQKDGFDAAEKLTHLIAQSKYLDHIQLIMLQGITMGGFNVVDVYHLNAQLKTPVLIISRNQPDMSAIRDALFKSIPQGKKKWEIIERLGPMEPVENVYVQRVGLSLEEARATIRHFTLYGNLPEPIRMAHLIATALTDHAKRGPGR